MKFIVLTICILTLSCSPKLITNATVDENGYLLGIAQKSDFEKAPFSEWFNKEYTDYITDAQVIEQIKPLLKDVTIKAVMGTWCGDSRREVPAFYKILDQCEFNYKNLQMITVDRTKKSPGNEQEGLDITNVPTFIFYKKGVEINRFVEYPRETLEKDILKILKNEGYKHSYLD
jgi:thiol-disulfide isomerase/thioredoxin